VIKFRAPLKNRMKTEVTLGIDTTNKTMSVCLFTDQQLLASKILNVKKNHSLTLMPAIQELMSDVDLLPQDLTRIIVVSGPGSYTGARIGVVVAKTLAYTLQIPLFEISTLALIAINATNFPGLIVPIIDARRENVYAAIFRLEQEQLISIEPPQHLALKSLLNKLKAADDCLFLGEDVVKYQSEIKKSLSNVKFSTNFLWNLPKSSNLALLGENIRLVENIHDFTPNYLKLVEAEENWLKKQGRFDFADYQKTYSRYVEKI
jgi:tRNA threonylcarbamoyl adenosine modification protein YeaZ